MIIAAKFNHMSSYIETRTFGARCAPYHVNVTIEINIQTIYIMYITSIKIIILLISF